MVQGLARSLCSNRQTSSSFIIKACLSPWNDNIKGNSFYYFKPFPAKKFILKKVRLAKKKSNFYIYIFYLWFLFAKVRYKKAKLTNNFLNFKKDLHWAIQVFFVGSRILVLCYFQSPLRKRGPMGSTANLLL